MTIEGARSATAMGAAAPGLVPSKTTHEVLVNLAPSAVADRRVRRLKRAVWASGHLHGIAEAGHRPAVAWFVTLTYAKADAWRANHIRDAVTRFRNWCKGRGVPCRYTWVGEIQPERARVYGDEVVHYHLLAWLPVGIDMPKWDIKFNHRRAFWPHGMTNRDVAKAGVGYLMKYLSKLGELTRFPKGLRLYGIGGLSRDGRSVRAWFNLPQWAKAAYGVGDIAREAVGFVVRATREVLAPVWRVSRVPSGITLQKLREVPARFGVDQVPLGQYPGAFSTWPRATA